MDHQKLSRMFSVLDGRSTTVRIISEENEDVIISRFGDIYSVGILAEQMDPFMFEFSSAEVTLTPELDGRSRLVLRTSEFSDIFISISLDFIDESNRSDLLAEPNTWCKKAADLLGNRRRYPKPESVVAELMILLKALEKDPETRWEGPNGGKADIVTSYEELEVKSTRSKDGVKFKLSSSHQADHTTRDKPLYLVFVRLKSVREGGHSINSLQRRITEQFGLGLHLESLLSRSGYPLGKVERSYLFELLEEPRFYLVDEAFPSITNCLSADCGQLKYITDIHCSMDLTHYESYSTDVL